LDSSSCVTQTLEERARLIEGALDWVRNKGLALDEVILPLPNESRFVPVNATTPQQRESDLENVLNWIRSGKSDAADPTGEFKRLDSMLPNKRRQKPRELTHEIDESLMNWGSKGGVVSLTTFSTPVH
jgi:hypothetical protein